MISKDQVQHIAKLARLELTDAETEGLQKDMSEVLDYFNLLKKAPAFAKASAGKPKEDLRATRKDEISSSHDVRDKIIAAAPDKKDDYIKVKTILQ